MADDANSTNARPPVSKGPRAIVGAKEHLQRVLAYRRMKSQLSELSDTELEKLGLSRNMIRPIARQAARAA